MSVSALQELLARLSAEQLALGEEISSAKGHPRLLALLQRTEYYQEIAATATYALIAVREENHALRDRLAELDATEAPVRRWWHVLLFWRK